MSKAEEYFKEWDGLSDEDKYATHLYFKTVIRFAESYLQHTVNEITDEDISNKIENYIEKHGYKMHDLQLENDCITHSQVENIIEWFKNKILKR